jgi:hypothetical protein
MRTVILYKTNRTLFAGIQERPTAGYYPRYPMKKFNLRIFLISTAFAGMLSFVSFYSAFAETVDNNQINLFESLSAKAIYVFGFPLITLTSRFDIEPGYYLFFLFLIVNCFFYGLLIERLFFILKEKLKLIPARVKR